MESLRGIGQKSRESGLTVSALRFYDAAGVLDPAVVDRHNGYRFYAPDQLAVARLVAVLRRVGMPLAGIRRVLAVRHDPDAVDALAPADRLTDLADGPVTITVDGGDLTARSGPVIVRSTVVDGAFPDYRRLLRAAGDGIPVDVARVRAADTREMRRAQDGANYRLAVVRVDADGQLQIGAEAGHGGVGVNAEFLLQALDAGGPGQLMLELDGPIAPVVVRSAGSVSLLMPVRLDGGHP